MEGFKSSIDWGNELVASTWWIAHGTTAIRFVLHSREAVAHSLGPPGDPHTFVRWCEAFARCVCGYGVLVRRNEAIMYSPHPLSRTLRITLDNGTRSFIGARA